MRYIRQIDESDCGAACIAMIASHFRSNVSITYLREMAGTNNEGTTFLGLVKASSALGFDPIPLKGSEVSINKNTPCPFIAHITMPSQSGLSHSHYIVVKSIKRDRMLVFDPSPIIGKTIIKKKEFISKWSGHALYLHPNEAFVYRRTPNYLLSFLPLFKKQLHLFVLAALSSILVVVCGIIGSQYFRILIDLVLPSGSISFLVVLSFFIMMIVISQSVFSFFRNLLLSHLGYKADTSLLFTFLEHLLKLPLSFFDSRKTGEITSRFGDVLTIRNLISHSALSIFMDVVMLLVVGFFLFYTNFILFVIAAISLILNILFVLFFTKPYQVRYKNTMQGISKMQSFVVESVSGIATIKSYDANSFIFNKYKELQMDVIRESWESNKLSISQSLFGELLQGVGTMLLFGLGSFLILRSSFTVGQLISFSSLIVYFTGPIIRLIGLQPSIQEALVSAKRIGEILDLDTENRNQESINESLPSNFSINFNNINFRYAGRRYLFDTFSLNLSSGTSIGIIGPSGCGKTTIIKLLMKLYDPEEGSIMIGDIPLAKYNTEIFRSQIGYVPQEVFLFSGTIAENICFHREHFSYEDMVVAARKAAAYEFIMNLPMQFETMIEEHGSNLSGGERQRIALARALIGNPRIVILDEATSNLDIHSEREFMKAVISYSADGPMVIIIAHRLSTVRNCNIIHVINDGVITHSGNHEKLLGECSFYRDYFD